MTTDAYSCRNANYIQIHSGRVEACWGTDTSTCNKTGTYSLTDDQIIELFNFLIDNIYDQWFLSKPSVSQWVPIVHL